MVASVVDLTVAVRLDVNTAAHSISRPGGAIVSDYHWQMYESLDLKEKL
jgi:hypothetical protein